MGPWLVVVETGGVEPRPKALRHWYCMLSFVIGFNLPNPDEQG